MQPSEETLPAAVHLGKVSSEVVPFTYLSVQCAGVTTFWTTLQQGVQAKKFGGKKDASLCKKCICKLSCPNEKCSYLIEPLVCFRILKLKK